VMFAVRSFVVHVEGALTRRRYPNPLLTLIGTIMVTKPNTRLTRHIPADRIMRHNDSAVCPELPLTRTRNAR
jgi:hypothetical protein